MAGLHPFVPGLRLSDLFYREAVRPVLDRFYPGLRYSAALLGSGSDVLGHDTPISTDHQWGPRLLLFLSERDCGALKASIVGTLGNDLPRAFRGFSTHFGSPDGEGIRRMEPAGPGPVAHLVTVHTVRDVLRDALGVESVAALAPRDWLIFAEQRLLELTAGAVFHDGLEELEPMRARLRYFPRDVWLLRMAAAWTRIAQEEAFVGRAGDAGDDLGSAIVAARLVRDLMRLCFLLERRYAPYSKWIGTAFSRLACAEALRPVFRDALRATEWRARQEALCRAYEITAEMHNGLGITPPLPAKVSRFHGRPYMVIHAAGFAAALRELIADEDIRRCPPDIGAVDQWVDSTDVLTSADLCRRAGRVYERDL